jgi:hypothetical protein
MFINLKLGIIFRATSIFLNHFPTDRARFSGWLAILKTPVHTDNMYDIALAPWQL